MAAPALRLTTIGTGTAAPSPTRVQSGHLVQARGLSLLMDCGSGIAFRLAALGIRWQDITHLAITHFHADHVVDLPTLMYAWRYGDLPARSRPLEIIGPPGTLALLARLAGAFGEGLLRLGFPLSVRELPAGESLELPEETTLRSRKVPHTDESVAYSVERRGRRIVYTGDTGFDRGLAEWAGGCDVLLSECSLPAAMAMETHLTPEQCGELAAVAEPALLALTHFYPPVESVNIPALVAQRHGGAITLATDGWSLDLEER
jgi:ribonuclease BN (tRNA processing enzyme)